MATSRPVQTAEPSGALNQSAGAPAPPVGPVRPPHLSRRIGATPAEVSTFLEHVSDFSLTWTASKDPLGDLVLLLGEVLNNIVEHGGGPSGAMIDVTVTIGADAAHVIVIDNGTALPAKCLSDAGLPSHGEGIDDLPEGGFGWFIIQQIASEISYDRIDGRNHLVLSVPI